MKIALFSDSHGELGVMRHVLSVTEPDVVIHLGDYAKDAKAAGSTPAA